jgi:hypothetical protein
VPRVKLGGICLIFLPDIERQPVKNARFRDLGEELRKHDIRGLRRTAMQQSTNPQKQIAMKVMAFRKAEGRSCHYKISFLRNEPRNEQNWLD